MIYIGKGVWRIGDLGFWGQIDWIREQGFHAIMFHTSPRLPEAHSFDPDAASDADVERLRRALGLFAESHIHAPFCSLHDTTFVSPSRRVRQASIEDVSRSLELAAEVGVDTVTIHSGASHVCLDPREQRAYLSESLLALDERAADAGVWLCVEVADYFIDPSRFELLRELDLRQTGVTVDVGHLCLRDGIGLKAYGSIGNTLRHLRSLVRHLHVHDYDGQQDHIAIGAGHIDFDDISAGLRDIDYAGSLVLELSPAHVNPEQMLASRDGLAEVLRAQGLEVG